MAVNRTNQKRGVVEITARRTAISIVDLSRCKPIFRHYTPIDKSERIFLQARLCCNSDAEVLVNNVVTL